MLQILLWLLVYFPCADVVNVGASTRLQKIGFIDLYIVGIYYSLLGSHLRISFYILPCSGGCGRLILCLTQCEDYRR